MTLLKKSLVAACACATFASTSAHAEKFFGDSSISLLYSDQYEAFGGERDTATVFTFENATGHDWGDTFLFFDRFRGHGFSTGNDSIYGEFAPNLSLSWLTGQDLSFGPIKDVRLSGQYEYGGGDVNNNNLMYGLGLSWDVPGLVYFNTNFYYVDNDTEFDTKDDWQATVTWKAPIEAGSALFVFDGYIDYSSAVSGDHAADFHFNPQLKLDIGNFTGNPGVLLAGIEYSYWRNKYGNTAFDTENAISALVKFHF
ncbi:MAG: outer membrane protein OmpK [Marinobacter sp.]|uniref:outer membrane protein OmpK n=1 Tax=Marinobacter sp. TaxID=50741 RepID=UPI003F9A028A